MQPVPDELWRPVVRLLDRGDVLHRVSRGCMLASTAVCVFRLALNEHSPWHDQLFLRLVLPLWLMSIILGFAGIAISEVALRRARRLMIEYHGIDPEA
jgi:hypothetical protein